MTAALDRDGVQEERASDEPRARSTRRASAGRGAGRRGRAGSFYTRALSAADREALEDARDVEGLSDEVALLRMQVRRLIEEEPADLQLVQSGMRLLMQTLVAEQRLSGRQAEGLGDAAARLVEEFGALLGAPEESVHG